ncbi:uncharacterized protein LOC112986833 [Dromaius novaehollandiae]|uniref:Adenylyltransferase and sulfurtransferase uba4-like n=1 Tax=Dromaius novaehollandiae TaxID=8790 RepID=A0A8C4K7B6_DRONO|nr:adenylyltransferase and sulfurtransferase uba4-like [Dromaius novaehollandiae]
MATEFREEVRKLNVTDPAEMMDLAIRWVQKSFPNVESVSTETLQSWLEEKPEELLILDIREADEFEVSHLPGAIRIDPESNNIQEILQEHLQKEQEQQKLVVCYCTVGYRASLTAQRLNEFLSSERGQKLKPFLKIYNAKGGLAKWARERKGMVDKQERSTHLVHPYNAEWAKLLEPELQALI